MPVDFGGLFQFAAPPHTGGPWLLNGLLGIGMASASSEGRCLKKMLIEVERPWVNCENGVRLTFVCNPITWLMACHSFPNRQNLPHDFAGLQSTETFEAFAHQYLMTCPGAITRLFGMYEAGVVQRLEDQPMAFAEFAESIGVPDAFVQKIRRRAGPCSGSFCGGWLRTELRRADEKIFDLYDYW